MLPVRQKWAAAACWGQQLYILSDCDIQAEEENGWVSPEALNLKLPDILPWGSYILVMERFFKNIMLMILNISEFFSNTAWQHGNKF